MWKSPTENDGFLWEAGDFFHGGWNGHHQTASSQFTKLETYGLTAMKSLVFFNKKKHQKHTKQQNMQQIVDH